MPEKTRSLAPRYGCAVARTAVATAVWLLPDPSPDGRFRFAAFPPAVRPSASVGGPARAFFSLHPP